MSREILEQAYPPLLIYWVPWKNSPAQENSFSGIIISTFRVRFLRIVLGTGKRSDSTNKFGFRVSISDVW